MLAMGLSLAAMAQVYPVPTGVTGTEGKSFSVRNEGENPLKKHRPARGWFIEAGAGINVGFNGQAFDTRAKSGAGAGTAIDFNFGRHAPGKLLGFGFGLQGLKVSDRYVDYGRRQYLYAYGSLLFRAEDWLIPYVHAGFAYSRKGSPAGGIGVKFPIRFSSSVSLVPDLRLSAMRGNLFSDEGAAVGAVASATLGLRFTIGNEGRRKKAQKRIDALYNEDALLHIPDTPAPVAAPEPTTVRDTVYIRDTIRLEQPRYYIMQEMKVAEAPVVQQPSPGEIHKAKEESFNRSLSEAVLFETGSYELTFSAKVILNEVAEYILENPGLRTIVEGHTDDVGGDEMNLRLSRNRASAVVDYLVSCGVNPFMIASAGYGKARPKVPNTSADNRHRNRRVEVHFNSGR